MKITWNELIKLKERGGLRILDVIPGQGTDTTIIVEKEKITMPAILIKPKRGQLGGRLAQLCEMAKQDPGVAKRVELTRGLRVDALIERDTFRLQISRADVYPSLNEWRITVGNLPFDLTENTPEQMQHKTGYYLRGAWPITSITNG